MQLIIESTPIAVRNGLVTLLACPILHSLDDGTRGTAETVLAEVLNNIVEHAYAETIGQICVSLLYQPGGILVYICDHGRAFPQEELPQGTLPRIDSPEGLPEGGFGWFLIRSLVQGLTYTRKEACNHLSFLLPTNSIAHHGETIGGARQHLRQTKQI